MMVGVGTSAPSAATELWSSLSLPLPLEGYLRFIIIIGGGGGIV